MDDKELRERIDGLEKIVCLMAVLTMAAMTIYFVVLASFIKP